MKQNEYKRVRALKEDLMSDYIKVHHEVERAKEDTYDEPFSLTRKNLITRIVLRSVLNRFDEADNTNEFSNLLHDLQRGGLKND